MQQYFKTNAPLANISDTAYYGRITFRRLTWLNVLLKWDARHRMRRQMSTLSEYMLKDLGLSETDVLKEISKPFWRA